MTEKNSCRGSHFPAIIRMDYKYGSYTKHTTMQQNTPTHLLHIISESKEADKIEATFQELLCIVEEEKGLYNFVRALCIKHKINPDSFSCDDIYFETLRLASIALTKKLFRPGTYPNDQKALNHIFMWLAQIATNVTTNEYRKKKANPQTSNINLLRDLHDEEENKEELYQALEKAIPMLSKRDQRIIEMSFFTKGLSKEEIREILMIELKIPTKNAFSAAKGEAISRLGKLLDKFFKT